MDLVNHLTDRLLFAVPKKGRLQEHSLALLHGSDVQFHRHSRLDIALVKNLPIALIFLPAADIPLFVGEGRVALGITGRDQIAEHAASLGPDHDSGTEEVLDLNFGRCELQVEVPEDGVIQKPEELIGKTICTSFPSLSRAYFQKLEQGTNGSVNGHTPPLRTIIKELSGSVEAACALGVADGIVDLVESGETMRAAGLRPISTVLQTTAVLIKSKKPAHATLVALIASRIRGVITAQRYVLCTYNISRTKLDQACRITPGKRAPTVNSLDDQGWVAVQAMVDRSSIATTMDSLTEIGAEDILVMKIDNSRTG